MLALHVCPCPPRRNDEVRAVELSAALRGRAAVLNIAWQASPAVRDSERLYGHTGINLSKSLPNSMDWRILSMENHAMGTSIISMIWGRTRQTRSSCW